MKESVWSGDLRWYFRDGKGMFAAAWPSQVWWTWEDPYLFLELVSVAEGSILEADCESGLRLN